MARLLAGFRVLFFWGTRLCYIPPGLWAPGEATRLSSDPWHAGGAGVHNFQAGPVELSHPLHHRPSGEDSKGVEEGEATGWREPGSLSDTGKSLLADSCSATESRGLFVTAAGAACPDWHKGGEEGKEQGSPLLQEAPENGDPQLGGVQRPTSRTPGRAMNCLWDPVCRADTGDEGRREAPEPGRPR